MCVATGSTPTVDESAAFAHAVVTGRYRNRLDRRAGIRAEGWYYSYCNCFGRTLAIYERKKGKKNVRARERARYETHRQKKSVKFRHSWLKEGREEGSAFSYLSSIIERSRLPTHHTRRAPYVKTRCTSCQNLLNREKSMKCLRLHWASVYWAAPSCRPS